MNDCAVVPELYIQDPCIPGGSAGQVAWNAVRFAV
jgi:hypothetical protein